MNCSFRKVGELQLINDLACALPLDLNKYEIYGQYSDDVVAESSPVRSRL